MAEFYINQGGSWRKIKELWINQGGTWRKIKELWANQGGVWRKIYSGFTVLSNDLIDDVPGNSGDPYFIIGSDGSINTRSGVYAWGTPTQAGIGANYWIKITRVGGFAPTTGTTGSFVSLSSDKTWSLTAAVAGGARSSTNTYQIATDSGGATIVASGQFNLVSDRT